MYGKLFSQTFSGSMVGKGSTVFAIWAYVVAHTKPPGIVELNPVLIAAQIGTTAADVESAIEYLCAADPNSRTPDHEGRRMIREGQYQYSVPNYMRYRGLRNEEERREQDRERKRRSREAHKGNGAKPPAALVLPDWIAPEPWTRWIKIRPAKARTPDVLAAVIAKLDKMRAEGLDPNEIIANSLANGWQGLFRPDQKRGALAAASSTRPAITCSDCGQRAYTWTGTRCDGCYRAYMGVTDHASQAPAK